MGTFEPSARRGIFYSRRPMSEQALFGMCARAHLCALCCGRAAGVSLDDVNRRVDLRRDCSGGLGEWYRVLFKCFSTGVCVCVLQSALIQIRTHVRAVEWSRSMSSLATVRSDLCPSTRIKSKTALRKRRSLRKKTCTRSIHFLLSFLTFFFIALQKNRTKSQILVHAENQIIILNESV